MTPALAALKINAFELGWEVFKLKLIIKLRDRARGRSVKLVCNTTKCDHCN